MPALLALLQSDNLGDMERPLLVIGEVLRDPERAVERLGWPDRKAADDLVRMDLKTRLRVCAMLLEAEALHGGGE
jgi:hypothetical protein